MSELINLVSGAYRGWMLWNLFLAVIPLGLSVWLFRWQVFDRSPIWWLLLLVYIAFLPNAPYLLTDIIHLIQQAQAVDSLWVVALIFIPIYTAVILGGFQCYVISLINQNYYLKRKTLTQCILPLELLTHALCSLGIYLGRFKRFNSWELVTKPKQILMTTVDDLNSSRSIAIILLTFIILTVFYWFMKQVTLGLALRIRVARQRLDLSQ